MDGMLEMRCSSTLKVMKRTNLLFCVISLIGCRSSKQFDYTIIESNIHDYYSRLEVLEEDTGFYLGIRLSGLKGRISTTEVDYLIFGNDTNVYFIRWSINGSSGAIQNNYLGSMARDYVDSLVSRRIDFIPVEMILLENDSFDELVFMKGGKKGKVLLRRGQRMSLPEVYTNVYRLVLDLETVQYKWCD